MTSKYLALVGFTVLLAAAGCHRAPSDRPANGFRITVQDIVTDDNLRVARIAIASSAASAMIIDSGSGHDILSLQGGSLPMSVFPESTSGRGSVTLVASRIAPAGQPWAYMQFLIRAQAPSVLVGGPNVEALPIDRQLRSFFTVTAKSGDYSFDTPVEIATLRGKPVTLTLQRATK